MGAPQYEQAGADVAGSGTTGTIPVWSGSGTTLTNSGLLDDGTQIYTTTRNVGIGAAPWSQFTVGSGGTNSPAATVALHNLNANEYRLKLTSANFNANGNWLGLGLGFSNNYLKAAIIAEAKDANARADLHFALNAAASSANASIADSRMVITYGGNVGIGTASPAAKFHVKDATNRNIIMTSGTTGMKITSITDASAEADIGVQGNTVQFLTGGTERARITSAGNVHAASGTTTMTDGFFYIPAAAGAPTGVPTAIAGRVPMYYDTTNNNFYVYNGAWKKVLLA